MELVREWRVLSSAVVTSRDKLPTIEELEAILKQDKPGKVEILPDGSISVKKSESETLADCADRLEAALTAHATFLPDVDICVPVPNTNAETCVSLRRDILGTSPKPAGEEGKR